MQDLKFILPPILLVVVFSAFMVWLIIYTPTHNLERYDNNVICATDKGWGWNQKRTKTCYGIYELKIDPNIHYELQREGVK